MRCKSDSKPHSVQSIPDRVGEREARIVPAAVQERVIVFVMGIPVQLCLDTWLHSDKVMYHVGT